MKAKKLINMRTNFYTALIIFLAGLSVQAQGSNDANQGSVNVETHQFASATFNNRRALRVLLPPGYHAP
jgi:hypothetical protein